jgi:sterol desaturase/sphingolipid hydroxylase (fatty acid hydroxylase superfamily)
MDDLIRLFDVRGFLLLAVVFLPLERLMALRKEQRVLRRLWQTDLLYHFVNKLIIGLVLLAAIAAFGVLAARFVPAGIQAFVRNQSLWIQVPTAIVLCDLFFYAAHRTFHVVPALWRFHAVHHSIEELDWLASIRVHPVDQIITKGFSILPLYALGFSTPAIALFAAINMWQGVLSHANLRLRFGPLRWIVGGPEFHHWHHAAEASAYNRNFAAQVPLIDLLFGTLYMPKGKAPDRYGVDEAVPGTYLGQLLYPLRRRTAPSTRQIAET